VAEAAYGIDNTGRVVGVSIPSTGVTGAFQTPPDAPYVAGAPDNLGVLSAGDTWSQAYAINNKGQIVGDSGNNTGFANAFLYLHGIPMEKLNTTGSLGSLFIQNAVATHAAAINDYGWIVGSFWTTAAGATLESANQAHSLISFGPGTTQSLDYNLGNPAYSQANDVNNNSQVVGFLGRNVSDQPTAYLFDFNTLP
jgi:probable HAF family extracellular repeat protein